MWNIFTCNTNGKKLILGLLVPILLLLFLPLYFEGLNNPILFWQRGVIASLRGPARQVAERDAMHQVFSDVVDHIQKSKRNVLVEDLPLLFKFEPDEDVEFPYENRTTPRIPHIIHQMWLTTDTNDSVIPEQFLDNVKAFIDNNPDWTYYFWTDITAKAFLKAKYPKILNLYNGNPKAIVRSDLIRYVVLYEYGGVYVDLDTLNFRNMDVVTYKYSCILVPVPCEQSILELNTLFYLANGEMLCRAKHPLFKQIVDFFEKEPVKIFPDYLLGPKFLTSHFLKYYNINQELLNAVDVKRNSKSSPYFYHGNFTADDENGVFIPNRRYFLDSHTKGFESLAAKKCNRTAESAKSKLLKRACELFKLKGITRARSKFAFLDHTFAYSWGPSSQNRKTKYVPVHSVKHNFRTFSTSG